MWEAKQVREFQFYLVRLSHHQIMDKQRILRFQFYLVRLSR